MKNFNPDEIPDEIKVMRLKPGEELRCPQFNPKKGDICNRKFCNGEASPDPQEFKCPSCGKKTTFQRLGH